MTLLDVNTIGELLDGGPDEQDTSGWETPAISTAPYAVQSRTVCARPTPPPHPMPPSLHRYAVQSPDKKLTLYVTSISEAEATAIDGKRLGRVDIRYRVTDPDGATAEATITLVITDQQRKCTTGHVLQVGVRGYTCVACEPGTYEFNNLVCMEVVSLHYINRSAAVEENKRGCGAQKQHRILYNEHGVVEMQAGRHCHHRRRHHLTSSTSLQRSGAQVGVQCTHAGLPFRPIRPPGGRGRHPKHHLFRSDPQPRVHFRRVRPPTARRCAARRAASATAACSSRSRS